MIIIFVVMCLQKIPSFEIHVLTYIYMDKKIRIQGFASQKMNDGGVARDEIELAISCQLLKLGFEYLGVCCTFLSSLFLNF